MKTQITMKAVKAIGKPIVAIRYGEAYHLLMHRNPDYYTAGTYGWSADVYDLPGRVIVTGYRPFGKSCDYEVLKEYERKAEELIEARNQVRHWTPEYQAETERMLAQLRQEWLNHEPAAWD